MIRTAPGRRCRERRTAAGAGMMSIQRGAAQPATWTRRPLSQAQVPVSVRAASPETRVPPPSKVQGRGGGGAAASAGWVSEAASAPASVAVPMIAVLAAARNRAVVMRTGVLLDVVVG